MINVRQLRDALAGLSKRDLIIAIVTVTVVLVLAGNLLVLKPQRLALDKLRAQEMANQNELASILKQIAELDQVALTGGMFAAERQKLAELQAQIAQVDAFFAQSDPTLAQVGGLVRRMIEEDSGLTLVSLKMLPSSVFYAPPAPKAEKESGLGGGVDSVLKTVKKDEPAPVILTERTLYKHGLEVNVKGSYPALVAYQERIQDYPKRLFWHEAAISVPKYPETSLKLTIYSLSDQAQLPLN